MTRSRKTVGLAVFILVTFAAAGVGSLLMSSADRTWFENLNKPEWQPPNWAFGPVWTFLYACIALAGWLFWWQSPKGRERRGLVLFAVQLVLNAAWTGLFFALQRPDIALVEILLLWVAIAATFFAFARWSIAAAVLLVPYWAWAGFAAILNYRIWRMN